MSATGARWRRTSRAGDFGWPTTGSSRTATRRMVGWRRRCSAGCNAWRSSGTAAGALHVFRDETGLSTNPHLWSAIETALDDSDWFVLLASPESAASEWVNKEVAHWVATKPVGSHPAGRDRRRPGSGTRRSNDFTADSTAVPPALRGALRDEARHLDLRWARDETDLDLRNSRFRAAVADLAAPMHGIAKDDLEGEDIRQHRRARTTRARRVCRPSSC